MQQDLKHLLQLHGLTNLSRSVHISAWWLHHLPQLLHEERGTVTLAPHKVVINLMYHWFKKQILLTLFSLAKSANAVRPKYNYYVHLAFSERQPHRAKGCGYYWVQSANFRPL